MYHIVIRILEKLKELSFGAVEENATRENLSCGFSH